MLLNGVAFLLAVAFLLLALLKLLLVVVLGTVLRVILGVVLGVVLGMVLGMVLGLVLFGHQNDLRHVLCFIHSGGQIRLPNIQCISNS